MIWQLVTVGAFILVLAVWAAALGKGLPQLDTQVTSVPDAERTYWNMSPRINERLRHLNDQLDRFWRPEATDQQ